MSGMILIKRLTTAQHSFACLYVIIMTHNNDCTLSCDTVFLRPGGHPQMEPEPGAAGLPRLGTSCMEMKMTIIFCIYI